MQVCRKEPFWCQSFPALPMLYWYRQKALLGGSHTELRTAALGGEADVMSLWSLIPNTLLPPDRAILQSSRYHKVAAAERRFTRGAPHDHSVITYFTVTISYSFDEI